MTGTETVGICLHGAHGRANKLTDRTAFSRPGAGAHGESVPLRSQRFCQASGHLAPGAGGASAVVRAAPQPEAHGRSRRH